MIYKLNTTFRNSRDVCDDIIGLANLAVDLKEVANSKFTDSLDVNMLSECINNFAAACDQSDVIRRAALSKVLL